MRILGLELELVKCRKHIVELESLVKRLSDSQQPGVSSGPEIYSMADGDCDSLEVTASVAQTDITLPFHDVSCAVVYSPGVPAMSEAQPLCTCPAPGVDPVEGASDAESPEKSFAESYVELSGGGFPAKSMFVADPVVVPTADCLFCEDEEELDLGTGLTDCFGHPICTVPHAAVCKSLDFDTLLPAADSVIDVPVMILSLEQALELSMPTSEPVSCKPDNPIREPIILELPRPPRHEPILAAIQEVYEASESDDFSELATADFHPADEVLQVAPVYDHPDAVVPGAAASQYEEVVTTLAETKEALEKAHVNRSAANAAMDEATALREKESVESVDVPLESPQGLAEHSLQAPIQEVLDEGIWILHQDIKSERHVEFCVESTCLTSGKVKIPYIIFDSRIQFQFRGRRYRGKIIPGQQVFQGIWSGAGEGNCGIFDIFPKHE